LTQTAALALINASVITLDPRHPRAEAVAVSGDRILHVGTRAEVLALASSQTNIVDVQGGIAIPAFHDPHLHLHSYARNRSRVDCRDARGIGDIQVLLRKRAAATPDGWIRATGYDDALFVEQRHPTRWDLDAVVPGRPVRLQHRSRHLDVFNTAALRLLRLPEVAPEWLEVDAETSEPTGRLYNGGELLQRIMPRSSQEELARDVRVASDELLSRGITTVQDATYTNRPDELDLFRRLSATGDLRVRTVVFRSARHWREFPAQSDAQVQIGPIKIMLDEATTDALDVRHVVAQAHEAGESVAFHAVSEAEIAIALDALRSAPPRSPGTSLPPGGRGGGIAPAWEWTAVPDRIEHGAVIPDVWLPDLRAAGVCVVGQPALAYERGDVYRREYPPEQHGWLHRARSLVDAGVPFAAGSDAPVTDPNPILGMIAARTRRTVGGAWLGRDEALTAFQALAAFTHGPAVAIGLGSELGMLQRGGVADIAVLDPDVLDAESPDQVEHTTRVTIMNGQIVWERA
jgi:predicted amidohydrolase YtcJ